MLQREFDSIMDRLGSMFKLPDNEHAIDEYRKILLSLEYSRLDVVIDLIMFQERKPFEYPMPGEIYQLYKQTRVDESANVNHCYICENHGGLTYMKKIDGIEYNFFARCTCEYGMKFKYNPDFKRNLREPMGRPYKDITVYDVFDPKEIFEIELYNKTRDRKAVPAPDYIKELLTKIGINV